jgi:hypothetical protein
MPALDEECALGQLPSDTPKPASIQGEPSRLTKVKSAVQSKMPFWGSKQKQMSSDANGAHGQQLGDTSMNYTSDMVDVLDTLGMC